MDFALFSSSRSDTRLSKDTREINKNCLALFTSNMQRLTAPIDPVDPTSYWHAAILAKKGRHYYIYSASFNPSFYTSIEKGRIAPQISSEKGLSLVSTTIGWIKHPKSTYSGIWIWIWLAEPRNSRHQRRCPENFFREYRVMDKTVSVQTDSTTYVHRIVSTIHRDVHPCCQAPPLAWGAQWLDLGDHSRPQPSWSQWWKLPGILSID